MSYVLQIPDEDKYYFNGYMYVDTLAKDLLKLVKVKYCAMSKGIKLEKGDTIVFSYYKKGVDIVRNEYPESNINFGDFKCMLTSNSKFIEYHNGVPTIYQIKPYQYGLLTPIKSNGSYTPYTEVKTISFLNEDYKTFENEDVVIYKRQLTDELIEDYPYIFASSFIPNKYFPKEIVEQIGFSIIRQGDNPYGNWEETQNKLALKHLLYQSHIKKRKEK